MIRDENPGDFEQVRRIVNEAFESSAEASLVEHLREQASPLISLVAEESGSVVGHIMFSPVTIENFDGLIFGLAPMAVAPSRQRHGVGSALVREGLERCRAFGAVGVVVLGHPAYYPRFGFASASGFGLSSVYEVPDDAFMALELVAGGFGPAAGQVNYHPAFNAL